MSDQRPSYVRCRLCREGMDSRHAESHLQTHIDAGDLIREAHLKELMEADPAADLCAAVRAERDRLALPVVRWLDRQIRRLGRRA